MSAPSPARELTAPAAAALVEARRRAGLGLREAARRAGIGHQYLLRLERGERRPSTAVALALAEALDLPLGARSLLLRCASADAGRSSPRRSASGGP